MNFEAKVKTERKAVNLETKVRLEKRSKREGQSQGERERESDLGTKVREKERAIRHTVLAKDTVAAISGWSWLSCKQHRGGER